MNLTDGQWIQCVKFKNSFMSSRKSTGQVPILGAAFDSLSLIDEKRMRQETTLYSGQINSPIQQHKKQKKFEDDDAAIEDDNAMEDKNKTCGTTSCLKKYNQLPYVQITDDDHHFRVNYVHQLLKRAVISDCEDMCQYGPQPHIAKLKEILLTFAKEDSHMKRLSWLKETFYYNSNRPPWNEKSFGRRKDGTGPDFITGEYYAYESKNHTVMNHLKHCHIVPHQWGKLPLQIGFEQSNIDSNYNALALNNVIHWFGFDQAEKHVNRGWDVNQTFLTFDTRGRIYTSLPRDAQGILCVVKNRDEVYKTGIHENDTLQEKWLTKERKQWIQIRNILYNFMFEGRIRDDDTYDANYKPTLTEAQEKSAIRDVQEPQGGTFYKMPTKITPANLEKMSVMMFGEETKILKDGQYKQLIRIILEKLRSTRIEESTIQLAYVVLVKIVKWVITYDESFDTPFLEYIYHRKPELFQKQTIEQQLQNVRNAVRITFDQEILDQDDSYYEIANRSMRDISNEVKRANVGELCYKMKYDRQSLSFNEKLTRRYIHRIHFKLLKSTLVSYVSSKCVLTLLDYVCFRFDHKEEGTWYLRSLKPLLFDDDDDDDDDATLSQKIGFVYIFLYGQEEFKDERGNFILQKFVKSMDKVRIDLNPYLLNRTVECINSTFLENAKSDDERLWKLNTFLLMCLEESDLSTLTSENQKRLRDLHQKTLKKRHEECERFIRDYHQMESLVKRIDVNSLNSTKKEETLRTTEMTD